MAHYIALIHKETGNGYGVLSARARRDGRRRRRAGKQHRRRSVKFLIPTALLVLSLTTAASAAEKLPAYGKTALSITGDVMLSAEKITFGNGKSVAVKKIASGREGKWDPIASGTAKADVYELTKPEDPKLLRGNRLCGSGPVRYVAFFRTDDKLTEMVVFQPKADPFGSDPDRICATYTYGG